MECPNCKKETLDPSSLAKGGGLEKVILLNVEVDYCRKCEGIWFDDNELRWAKDEKDANLNWIDIDLWRYPQKFNISRGGRLCPRCRMPLYEVEYDKSKVKIDLCNLCKGIWLDKGEFKKTIKYLKEKADYEILNYFSKNLIQEFWEVFSGPESVREEISDLVTILKLFNYRFTTQHPYLATIIKGVLPKP